MSLHSNYERNMKMHPVKGYRQIVYVKIKLYQFMKLHRYPKTKKNTMLNSPFTELNNAHTEQKYELAIQK